MSESSAVALSRRHQKDIVLFLKGGAIAAVLIQHYIDLFLKISPLLSVANGIIAVFFVLSGYGIRCSFDVMGSLTLRNTLKFYLKRAMRIFPLYWLSLIMAPYSTPLREFSPAIYTVSTFLASPFSQAPSLYWFVTSIMQCYLLAPLLYLLLQKAGRKRYLLLIVILLALSYGGYPFTGLSYDLFDHFVYRFLFLGHLFIFSLGMVLPSFVERAHKVYGSNRFVMVSGIIFLAAVYMTRQQNKFFANSGVAVAPLFVLSALFFCSSMIVRNPQLPFRRAVALMGTCSYSLYLFHPFYYESLVRLCVITSNTWTSMIFTLGLMPVFIFLCLHLEKAEKSINYRLGRPWA